MTIEEVLEIMLEAFKQRMYGSSWFAQENYRVECSRVLEDAERLGIRFS